MDQNSVGYRVFPVCMGHPTVGVPLSALALQFGMDHTLVATTLAGFASAGQAAKNVTAYRRHTYWLFGRAWPNWDWPRDDLK